MRSSHLVGSTVRYFDSRALDSFDQRAVTLWKPALLTLALAVLTLPLAGCEDEATSPVPAPELDAAQGKSGAHRYRFTRIADTRSDRFDPFEFGCPALNNEGVVAFRGRRNSGATGIYRGSGGALTIIVQDNSDRFTFIGLHPSINDRGAVSFAASVRSGGEAIFRGRGGPLTTIARTEPGRFNFFGFDTSVDGQGNVAFKAELDTFDEGLFVGAGGAVSTVYLASSSRFQGNDVGPASNEIGRVAFQEDLDAGPSGIFRWTGAGFVTIATDDGPIGGFFSPPALSDGGVVAFHVGLDDGTEAILKGSGGPLTTVADTRGAFSFFNFAGPSVNSQALVAFSATLDSGEQGLFVGPDPVADRVVGTGDKFRGAVVTNVVFCREGLNNSGQLAFQAQLDDGRAVIVRATPKS